MIRMRNIFTARFPDGCADPAKRRDDHICDSAKHENLKRAVPFAKGPVKHTESAITRTENHPGNQARRQEMARHKQESKNRDEREKTQNYSCSHIALHRKSFQEREMIRDDQPRRENQRHANTSIYTRSNRRIAEDVEPTVTGQMRSNGHPMLGSQATDNCLTRTCEDGCVTSTARGALGALSFPARSTAVTVYQ